MLICLLTLRRSTAARKLLKSMSVKQGLKYDSAESAREIPTFIAFHNLNVDEIKDPLDSFSTCSFLRLLGLLNALVFRIVQRVLLPVRPCHALLLTILTLPLSKLKETARPLESPTDPARLVSCADCRMMAFETVSDATRLWIKGREFSVKRLLGETYGNEFAKYDGGALGIFRLAPQVSAHHGN